MHKEEKRHLILKNSFDIFLKYGYDGAKISEIATISNIGKSTIYEYFSSKEEIFIECMKYIFNVYNNSFVEIIESNKSFKEKIHDFVFFNKEVAKYISNGVPFIQCGNPNITKAMGELLNNEKEYLDSCFDNMISEAIENKEIDADINKKSISLFIKSSIFLTKCEEFDEDIYNDILKLTYRALGI